MPPWLQSALAGFEKEAWKRFFLALGGLALAFAAAIFSTVTRQSGNVIATALLASLALLLAGAVGLTTVPYLARRVAVRRVSEAFDYDITREGVVYLGLILLIGIAALNTGNNLLFIVVSAMLAAIVVSGILSAAMLRSLELEVTLPEHVFANAGVLGRVALRNRRRLLPSFSVSVRPPKPAKGRHRFYLQHSTFHFPPRRPRHQQWVHWPDISLHWAVERRPEVPGIFREPMYFAFIPPHSGFGRDLELRFPRRGRYVQEGFGVSTRFPFSFLAKTRRVPLSREIVVYPPVEPTDELFSILPLITGEFEAFVRGRGYDLYRIREYLPEDSARHVDWKASARTGSIMVREFTREDERKLRLVFDNPGPGTLEERAYEAGVALAASLGWHFAGDNTELSFAAPGYSGGADIYDFLRYLALVSPATGGGPELLEKLDIATDDYNVIFTARPRGSIPTPLWACSYFVFFGEQR